jgi:hypothetical protein
MAESEMRYAAAGPVHYPGQQDNGNDNQNEPKEEHYDAGDNPPAYGSGSSHGNPSYPPALDLFG